MQHTVFSGFQGIWMRRNKGVRYFGGSMLSGHMVVEYIAHIKSAAQPRGMEKEYRCALLQLLNIEIYYWRCLEQLTQPGVTLSARWEEMKEEQEKRKKNWCYRSGGGALKQGDIPPPNCPGRGVSEERSYLPVLESEDNTNKRLQRFWTSMRNWSKLVERKTCVKHPAHIHHWLVLHHPLAAHKQCSLSGTSHKAPSQFLVFLLNQLYQFAQIFCFGLGFWSICTSTTCRLCCQHI